MTMFKDHSAQAIFEALMLDPDLEVREGQTREEAAKHEAEFRARQHWNNMRALALGTTELDLEKSPIRALADFLTRPQTFFAEWLPEINLVKAKWDLVHNYTNYEALSPEQKLHDDALGNMTPEGTEFLKLLADNGASPSMIAKIGDMANDYRNNDEDYESKPNGWIDYVSAAIGHHSGIVQVFADLGIDEKVQKKLSAVLHNNHYNAPAPPPKALTHNPDWLKSGKYGSNDKDLLETHATVHNINLALEQMGRKERVDTGGSSKLKFLDNLGNVKQWKAYKDAPDGQKRVRIHKNQVDSNFEGPDDSPILGSEIADYTVAQILNGLFHHTDMDLGQHDITSDQAQELNQIHNDHEDHLDQVDDSVDNVDPPSHLESVSEEEFDFVFGGKSAAKNAAGEAMPEPWNHDTPIKLSYTGHHDAYGAFKEFHDLAIEHGICDEEGYMTHEHIAHFKQACKDGILDKSHVQKWTDDDTSSPTHGQTFYFLQHKKSANEIKSGLHKYINHIKANPVIPPKAAAELAVEEPVKEAPEYGADTVSDEEIKAALDKTDEEVPKNHPDPSVSEQMHMAAQSNAVIAAAKEHYIVNPGSLHSMGYAVKGHDAVQNEAAKWDKMAQDFVLDDNAVANLQLHIQGAIQEEPGLIVPLQTHLAGVFPQGEGGPALFDVKHLKDSPNADIAKMANDLSLMASYGFILDNPNMMQSIGDMHGKSGSQHFATNMAAMIKHINEFCQSPGAANVHPMALVQMAENWGFSTPDKKVQAIAPFIANHFAGQSNLNHAINNPMLPYEAAKYWNQAHNNPFDINEIHQEMDGKRQIPKPIEEYTPGTNKMNPEVMSEFQAMLKNALAASDSSVPADDYKAFNPNELMSFLKEHFLHEPGQIPKDDALELAQSMAHNNPQLMHDLYTNMVHDANQAAMEHFNEVNGQEMSITDLPLSQKTKLAKLNSMFQFGVAGAMTKPCFDYSQTGDGLNQVIKDNSKYDEKMFAHEALVSNIHGKIWPEMGPLSLTGGETASMNTLADLGKHNSEMSYSEVSELLDSVKSSYPEITGSFKTEHEAPEGLLNAFGEQIQFGASNPNQDPIEGSPLQAWELEKNEDGPYAKKLKQSHITDYEAAVSNHLDNPEDEVGISQVKEAIGKGLAAKAITHDEIAQSGVSSAVVSDAISDHFGQPSQIETSVNSFSQAEDALVGASHNLNSAIAGGDKAEISAANHQLNQAKQNSQPHMDSQDIEDMVTGSLDDAAISHHYIGDSSEEAEEQAAQAQMQADEEESQALDEKEQAQAYDDYHSALKTYDDAVASGHEGDIDIAQAALYDMEEDVKDILGDTLMSGMKQDALQPKAHKQWTGQLPYMGLQERAAYQNELDDLQNLRDRPGDSVGEDLWDSRDEYEDEDDQQENIDIELPDADLEDEEETSQVEEELDTVDDAAEGLDRQKAEIMQEVFGRDQDSSDAKKYQKFLDKQKPEKIESLHEKHVIGNIEKKALKAKADKVKQKLQDEKASQKADEKAEAEKTKAEEKQQQEDEKAKQKEADTLPHKPSEIAKKIQDGQDPKQMARENMIHQHQHEDNMSPKTQKEYEEAHQKFEAAGVDMDSLIAEKDEHGEDYGSEEHQQTALNQDAKNDQFQKNYQDRISSDDYEEINNRANAFRAGQPGKFTEFDDKGNPVKDLHHKVNQHGESSLESHDHGQGPEAETKDASGNDLKSHHIHHDLSDDDRKAVEDYKNSPEGSPEKEAAKQHLEDEGIDLKDVDGPSEDDIKSGPPDPEVARRKMAEGYVWHEETRHWILKDSLKELQGGMGAHGAAMVHGNALMGKAGQMVQPFASKEDGSTADSHFVAHQGGVHQVGTPNTTPGGSSSHNHIAGAALGHALQGVQPGANGVAHLGNNALSPDGALGKVGLAQAGNHVKQFPTPKNPIDAVGAQLGGAMDKLKGMLNLEEIEDESAVEKLYVKYK